MTSRKQHILSKLVRDFSHLVYPEMCVACNTELSDLETDICSFCDQSITKTNYHLFQDASDMDKLFWGRCDLEFTHAHMFFKKDGASQSVLFDLKYKNNAAIGKFLGQRIGKELFEIKQFNTVDVLIPVPLHPKKKFIRGYNQSEEIAKGISQSTNKSINTGLIIRNKNTATQTKKSRFERWDNVNNIFKVDEKVKQIDHVLLVDDVITTGSTIENMITNLRAVHPKIKVSVVTLAIA